VQAGIGDGMAQETMVFGSLSTSVNRALGLSVWYKTVTLSKRKAQPRNAFPNQIKIGSLAGNLNESSDSLLSGVRTRGKCLKCCGNHCCSVRQF